MVIVLSAEIGRYCSIGGFYAEVEDENQNSNCRLPNEDCSADIFNHHQFLGSKAYFDSKGSKPICRWQHRYTNLLELVLDPALSCIDRPVVALLLPSLGRTFDVISNKGGAEFRRLTFSIEGDSQRARKREEEGDIVRLLQQPDVYDGNCSQNCFVLVYVSLRSYLTLLMRIDIHSNACGRNEVNNSAIQTIFE